MMDLKSELKSEIAALSKLMEVEHRRMADVLPLANSAPGTSAHPGAAIVASATAVALRLHHAWAERGGRYVEGQQR